MGAEFGLFGLGRVGGNLARNALSRGLKPRLFDRSAERIGSLRVALASAEGRFAIDESDFVASLASPRIILLSLPAGKAVDEAIERFLPLLSEGDAIVDAGDSWFRDSERREVGLAERGILFSGLGISGSAEDVLQGPAFMAGGGPGLRQALMPLLERLCAMGPDGRPCAIWVGPSGAGHFVKMTHNAIEYADMEILAEAYHILKSGLRANREEVRNCFASWERSEVSSRLLSLSVDVLSKDDADGTPLIDRILDRATQKGSGIRATEYALELGVQASTLSEAVFARNLSTHKDERVMASALLGEHVTRASGSPASLMDDVRKAVLASKIIAYSEGFALLSKASEVEGWSIDPVAVAHVWRSGALIRGPFLDHVAEAYSLSEGLPSLLHDARMKILLDQSLPALRRVVARAIESGLPIPLMTAAVSSFDGQRSSWLPANLIQALRDRFGGHGFERVDRPRGEIHFADWEGGS